MWFVPRTIDVMSSLSLDEQKHLYHKISQLKKTYVQWDADALDQYRIWNWDLWIYEVFLEDSTRTRESFTNAISFHQAKSNNLDVSHSSFNKKESYTDTFNMLTGYHNQIFIVRSKLEWVCTWLKKSCKDYIVRKKLPFEPIFINAGDGRHQHPTQELLDQFTFLEQNNWNTSMVHIALIWDLLHGRTMHSKVDGLRIYDNVIVDLIAPEVLALPPHYIQQMQQKWYTIRQFDSIDSYLAQQDLADIWYFTRMQLERMWEWILKQEKALRKAITCTHEHIGYLDSLGTSEMKFYHPLPRHKETPVIPTFVDATKYNGRETQARNGYFVRIVLLWALAGVPAIVDDFAGETVQTPDHPDDFVQAIDIDPDRISKKYSEWVNPLKNGISIDHIAKWSDIQTIKKQLQKIVSVLWLYTKWGERVSQWSNKQYKWIIFRPDIDITTKQIRKLAAVAPWCTLNRIQNQKVIEKIRLTMPPKLYDFDQMSCKNSRCISHSSHNEQVPAEFIRNSDNLFVCEYCWVNHEYGEVWDI